MRRGPVILILVLVAVTCDLAVKNVILGPDPLRSISGIAKRTSRGFYWAENRSKPYGSQPYRLSASYLINPGKRQEALFALKQALTKDLGWERDDYPLATNFTRSKGGAQEMVRCLKSGDVEYDRHFTTLEATGLKMAYLGFGPFKAQHVFVDRWPAHL